MEEIAQRGEAKQLGISNIYDIQILQDLYEMANIKPSVVQNRFYEGSGYDKEIRNFCKIHNIIYQSFWTLTANPHILQSTELIELSKKYNKNVIQLFFAYLNKIGITPLTGTTNIEHMQSDLESFDIVLDDTEILKLNSLFK
jgi:diketogulonate reductase-like aldo/keto reductase